MSWQPDPTRQRRLGEVLDAALAHEPRSWPAIVDAACPDDPDLRTEVLDLLQRVDVARQFLVSPPSEAAAALIAEPDGPTTDLSGRRIGAYSIIREIGRGGMSRVFLARRADGQFEQDVALKLLRPGLDTELDRARFRAERQIVASLNHPNIARLFDGGLTDEGQPYLVLEYVDGQPIDVYCESRGLSERQRISLFLKVAEATQYAHRNLIIHRDIKASNILVDAGGGVKLLDFGLAKLLEPGAFEAPRPDTVAHWMTPEYAAPEQIRRRPITTLTDVYQLGVVLYRLLTNRLPFTADARDRHDLEVAVLREDPPPPSSVVATDQARARHLRGDLDAIVLKALRKEPEERFASVEAFADDLRRYLSGHPVRSRRSTSLYRARRFVQRHRVETVAALAITISLALGAGIAFTQAGRAARQRDIAADASRESQAVTAFVLGLFETSDPAETRGDTLTAAELVRRAAARAELLRNQPLAQARMLEVTAQLYHSLGQVENARAMLERALDIRQTVHTGEPLDVAGTLTQLASELRSLGRYAAADSDSRAALRIQTQVLGPEHPALANTLHQMASIAVFRGDLVSAEAFHRRALAVRERALGPNDSLTAESHLALGATLRAAGQISAAEGEFRTGLAILEKTVEPNGPEIAQATLQIAYVLDTERGEYDEAEPLYRRALEIRRIAYGNAHPMVAATLLDFAEFQSRHGDHVAAIEMARQGMEIIRRAYGNEHPLVADFMSRLATVLQQAGKNDEAAALFRDAIAMDRRLLGGGHESVAGLEMNLARLLVDRGDLASAESPIREAIDIRRNGSGPNSPGYAEAMALYGMLLTREHRFAAADSTLRTSLRIIERQVGRRQRNVREMYGWLADLEDARGRRDDAARYRAIAATR